MTIQEFETLSFYIGIGSLVLFCIFIMYRLSKDSNAGKFGTIIIFIALGAGIFGFVIKEIIMHLMKN